MNWQQSLDRYLTSGPPDDGFEDWTEKVTESFTNDFFDENDEWIVEYDGQCNSWFNKLFDSDCEPEYAAKLIERAFKLYKL